MSEAQLKQDIRDAKRFRELMLKEYESEISDMSYEELKSLIKVELETYTDTEKRLNILNRLIDKRYKEKC